MTIEQGLVAELIGDAGVTAIVGTKVHPGAIPQDTELPAIVYTRVSTPRELALDGTVEAVAARFRLDIWHTSYSNVKTLAEAVRTALNNIGIGAQKTLGSESVQAVYIDDEADLPVFDGDQRDHRVSQDWIVVYTES